MATDEWEDLKEVSASKFGVTWSLGGNNSRRRKKSKCRKLKNVSFDSYDRADLYVNDYVNYMGISLMRTESEDLSHKCFELKPSQRVIYFQVDDIDPAVSNKDIAAAWLRSYAENEKTSKGFPSEISIEGGRISGAYDCTNYHPEGDECIFDHQVERSSWIGGDGRFLGSVYMAPQLSRNRDAAAGASKLYPTDQNEWTKRHSFKTWTRIKPTHSEKRLTT